MKYPLTDVGNAERLLASGKVRYHDGCWEASDDDGTWMEVDADQILMYAIEAVRSIPTEYGGVQDSRVHAFAKKSESLTRLRAMIKIAEVMS